MTTLKLRAAPADTPLGAPSDPLKDYRIALIAWRRLCESLVFAAPYSTAEYLKHLDVYADQHGFRYDRDVAIRRCRDLALALEDTYPQESSPLRRCHAAIANPLFFDRNAHLFPKQPPHPTRPSRDPATEAERMARAEALAAAL